jgi:hypothetical protein
MCVKATLLVRQPWLQACLDKNRTSGGQISIEANEAFFTAESTVKRKVFWISFLAGADEPETASCRPRQISQVRPVEGYIFIKFLARRRTQVKPAFFVFRFLKNAQKSADPRGDSNNLLAVPLFNSVVNKSTLVFLRLNE